MMLLKKATLNVRVETQDNKQTTIKLLIFTKEANFCLQNYFPFERQAAKSIAPLKIAI
jgi:uncharacterized protein (DUF2141 family)